MFGESIICLEVKAQQSYVFFALDNMIIEPDGHVSTLPPNIWFSVFG